MTVRLRRKGVGSEISRRNESRCVEARNIGTEVVELERQEVASRVDQKVQRCIECERSGEGAKLWIGII
jgi:hypothetical protein